MSKSKKTVVVGVESTASRQFCVTLPVEVHERLQKAVKREDRPMSWVVRRAIVAYLDNEEE